MRFSIKRAGPLAAVMIAAASLARAQQPAAAPKPGSAAFAPDSGKAAPDFTLPGATKNGVMSTPIHLADFRGQTVVLAFFPKARTKG